MRFARLCGGRYHLFGLLRNAARREELRAAGIVPLPGDLDRFSSLSRLAGLADTVLHFAPPPGSGEGDRRTRNLLATLSRGTLPKRLVYISTSGVYGDCGGHLVNEWRRPNPQSARAGRRLDAERQIRGWARRNRVHVVILRVPGIYAAERLPLERLRAGTPAIAASEDGYTNHIHADDLARVVLAALRYGKSGRLCHACDDSELKMGEYFDLVADAYGLPRPPRLPRAEVERTVSPGLWSFMRESRRLSNKRMKRELKAVLRHPQVVDALSPAAG